MSSKMAATAASAVAAKCCDICNSPCTSNDHELLHCFPNDPSVPSNLREVFLHISCGECASAVANKKGVVEKLRAEAGSKARVEAALRTSRFVTVGRSKYFLLKEVQYRLGSPSSGGSAETTPVAPKVSPEAFATLAHVVAAKLPPTAKHSKPAPEKRLRRHRKKPTAAISQRIARARTQRLFLVDSGPVEESAEYGGPSCTLTVLGSTGNVYHVTLCKVPSCSCPDHGKGNLCKHILFALIKVVGLPNDSDLVYQAALLSTELDEIFATLARRRAVLGVSDIVTANAAVRQQYAQLSGKSEEGAEGANEDGKKGAVERKGLDEATDCAICFDPLGESLSGLTYCRAACGTNFHAQCIKQWTSTSRKNVTCPACRGPWLDTATGGAAASSPSRKRSSGGGDGGYTNLGSLQGQSPDRDTSTYSEWYQHDGGWGSGGRYGRRRY